ncbi:Na+/H+ antiporter NhaC [Oceanobacillus oncorhynchi subsp. incaldanensis]|uniref:Na+/H+ antiporter NhaC n=1 Tax=Oceanobacillus aidingensis TaxID=645964 RepID=A0ABV9K2U0_9BACI|nr:Na+/H+ antiporter NhaC [Oceanobacillus oncorhynchi]MDM8099808.1 Na+/H+ antiporter NhaC [Oceanobacillus oncorhynchi]GIO20447.1 Na+/H+ antiporter NhaC [Oceanobacillus oncorhynchi subsp. incaldanensis]
MYRIKPEQMPSLSEAIFVIAAIIAIMSVSIIYFEAPPHIPLAISLLLLIIYGMIKKVPYEKLQAGFSEGAVSGMGAVFLFFMIGILIASWIYSGTIPTLIYGGFELVTPNFYYAIVFIITSLVGICVGSSLTTVATVGLAFIGISQALDISLAITAGSVVSGAFFGDKMSPISDTTNMASSILKVDLFEHIRNMMWTTVPAFLIALVIFGIISPSISNANFGEMELYQQGLLDTGLIHWYNAVVPLAVLVIFSIFKAPALLTLAAGALSAIVISIFHTIPSIGGLFGILFGGYVSETGIEQIDSLLTRGGMESMFFTIALILLALGMGGLLFKLGIVPTIFESAERMFQSVKSVIIGTAINAIGVNVLIGEQYLSILLTTETFQPQYQKLGLENKNLSRVSEDAGTVVNPLVPWSVCGVFIASVLDVPTLEYLPFAFFCLLCPVLTIIFGITGKTLTYTNTAIVDQAEFESVDESKMG